MMVYAGGTRNCIYLLVSLNGLQLAIKPWICAPGTHNDSSTYDQHWLLAGNSKPIHLVSEHANIYKLYDHNCFHGTYSTAAKDLTIWGFFFQQAHN